MKNIDITILAVMIAFSLYSVFVNLIKRFRYLENWLFVLVNITGIAMYSVLLIKVLDIFTNFSYLYRIYLCLLILSFQMLITIFHIFPRWEKRSPGYLILLTQIPGVVVIVLTLLTDKILVNTAYNNGLIHSYGNLIILYFAVFALYLLIFFIIMAFKYNNLKNESFKGQLIHLIITLVFGTIVFTVLFVILPSYFDNNRYMILGIAVFGFIPAFVMNYSISENRYFEINSFYLKSTVWALLLVGLIIPAYLFLGKVIKLEFFNNYISLIIGSIILSLYFFLFYHLLRPVAERIISKKDRKLSVVFSDVTNNIFRFSNIKKQLDWNIFFKQGIELFCEKLSIKSAYFFLRSNGSDFELIYEYGEKSKIQQVSVKHDVINALNKYKQIIEKSLIFTDPELSEFRNELFQFYKEHQLEVSLPVFSDKGELRALLHLGKLNELRSYSTKDYISFLDDYRLQLKILLEKITFSEEVRKKQIDKRDKMVVKNIKRRIIPTKFNEIKGFKISSIFIDNSEFGGDYFNTVKMNENKVGIFVANTSDMGIESALLALQINSIFQSQAQTYESPEILMNNINQVLCSSRFTDKYAASIYIIYNLSTREITFSNAAFNPILIFDPKKEGFTEFDAEGVPVGIDIRFHYKYRTTFAPIDSIGLIYSSGLISAFNEQGNNYSVSRIKDIIRINKNDEPTILVKKIYNDFKTFIQGNALLNDVSILIFRTV